MAGTEGQARCNCVPSRCRGAGARGCSLLWLDLGFATSLSLLSFRPRRFWHAARRTPRKDALRIARSGAGGKNHARPFSDRSVAIHIDQPASTRNDHAATAYDPSVSHWATVQSDNLTSPSSTHPWPMTGTALTSHSHLHSHSTLVPSRSRRRMTEVPERSGGAQIQSTSKHQTNEDNVGNSQPESVPPRDHRPQGPRRPRAHSPLATDPPIFALGCSALPDSIAPTPRRAACSVPTGNALRHISASSHGAPD